MKTSRATYVLLGLFLTGLLLLWGLDRAGVLTEAERLRRIDRVLPDLIDASPDDVHKIEIDREGDGDGDGERLVFERLGRRNWRMRAPLDAAADPGALQNVIANLKNLRKSPDAGTIQGSPEDFGLAPPAATVRLWGMETSPGASPLAALELGKTSRGNRYVRAGEGAGIEVVDKRALDVIDRPAVEWRETRPIPLSTFQIKGLAIHRPGLDVKAERGAGGRWRLTAPVRFPANDAKVEGALAALCSLRIKAAEGGFAADGVTDFAPFGLDEPAVRIELTPASADPVEPLVLMVGDSPKDDPQRVYVRRSDQNEVALVDGGFLAEIPTQREGFRDSHVAEVVPPAVDRIQIKAPEGLFEIVRARGGWELKSPRPGKADSILVDALLGSIDALQTSEFLDPKHLADAGLDPPITTLRVWQRGADGRDGDADEPVVALNLGIHDVLKKTIYAQVPGDSVVLALPDTFLSVLPKTSFAYGDLSLPAAQPERIDQLTIVLKHRTVVLEPATESATPNEWRMVSPVKARADAQAVATALATLANMRAREYMADDVGDGVRFGLNDPSLEVKWRYGKSGSASASAEPAETTSLRVGEAVPGEPGARYATLGDRPAVFALDEATLRPFVGEFHDTLVLSFPADAARRLILRSPDRTLAFARRAQPHGDPTDWTPEPGTSVQGVDLSRFNDLVKALSQLRTPGFLQYEGPIPESTGLAEPRLVVEVGFDGDQPPRQVRFGATIETGWIYAAVGDESSGPVFMMPAAAWEAMIPQAADEGAPALPSNVFAPG